MKNIFGINFTSVKKRRLFIFKKVVNSLTEKETNLLNRYFLPHGARADNVGRVLSPVDTIDCLFGTRYFLTDNIRNIFVNPFLPVCASSLSSKLKSTILKKNKPIMLLLDLRNVWKHQHVTPWSSEIRYLKENQEFPSHGKFDKWFFDKWY